MKNKFHIKNQLKNSALKRIFKNILVKSNYSSFQITLFTLITTITLTLTSCEKNITVDLPHGTPKVVVEGYVEIGFLPTVYLSYSTDYFAPIDSAALASYSITGATVVISDGTVTDTLIEVFPGKGYFYVATTMHGEAGKTYTLTVKTKAGETVTATTVLPQPIPLDSVWFKTQSDTTVLGFAWAHLTDPDTIGNNYRWFAKRLTKDSTFIPPIGSVFNDKFINAQSFDFAYNRGTLPNEEVDPNDYENGFYKIGDTIVVKFCAMDANSYNFWRSAEDQFSNTGNPFAAPYPIKSNITGGLGIFCGYAATYDTIYAK